MKGIQFRLEKATSQIQSILIKPLVKPTLDIFELNFSKFCMEGLQIAEQIISHIGQGKHAFEMFTKMVNKLKQSRKHKPEPQQEEQITSGNDQISQFLSARKPIKQSTNLGELNWFVERMEKKQKDTSAFLENINHIKKPIDNTKKLRRQNNTTQTEIIWVQKFCLQTQSSSGFGELVASMPFYSDMVQQQKQKLEQMNIKMQLIKKKGQQIRQQQEVFQQNSLADVQVTQDKVEQKIQYQEKIIKKKKEKQSNLTSKRSTKQQKQRRSKASILDSKHISEQKRFRQSKLNPNLSNEADKTVGIQQAKGLNEVKQGETNKNCCFNDKGLASAKQNLSYVGDCIPQQIFSDRQGQNTANTVQNQAEKDLKDQVMCQNGCKDTNLVLLQNSSNQNPSYQKMKNQAKQKQQRGMQKTKIGNNKKNFADEDIIGQKSQKASEQKNKILQTNIVRNSSVTERETNQLENLRSLSFGDEIPSEQIDKFSKFRERPQKSKPKRESEQNQNNTIHKQSGINKGNGFKQKQNCDPTSTANRSYHQQKSTITSFKTKIKQKMNHQARQSLPSIYKQKGMIRFQSECDQQIEGDNEPKFMQMCELSGQKFEKLPLERKDMLIWNKINQIQKGHTINKSQLSCYVQILERVHAEYCGKNCKHLQRFYKLIKTGNVLQNRVAIQLPTRKIGFFS